MTLEELADRAEMHRTSIGLVERGERSLTVRSAAQISEALGVRLSDLVAHAERQLSTEPHHGAAPSEKTASVVERSPKRLVDATHAQFDRELRQLTGLGVEAIISAIETTYDTVDLIDDELTNRGSSPISGMVELANLSSMLGNLLSAGLAEASAGAYIRNRPHAFPDLVPQYDYLPDLEVKTALETNRPKGHLPKAGVYLTFRYVLGGRDGSYTRGPGGRGATAWVWEVRAGRLENEDFSISNTPGDSGKTAVIKSQAFQRMIRVYFNPNFYPYFRKNGPYGEFAQEALDAE
jgi:transcriptional regulator with XRE-family HTH domain